MPAILITASMMGAAWILFTYFAPVLEERMGYGRNGVTFILVVFGAGAVIGNMLGGIALRPHRAGALADLRHRSA